MRAIIWLLFVFSLTIFSCPTNNTTIEDPEEELVGDIERVEVEYFFDNVSFRLTHKDTQLVETISGVEHNAEITSISGVPEQAASHFISDFNGVEVLGKTLTGRMYITFKRRLKTVHIDVWQRRRFSSFLVGDVNQAFSIEASAIPLNRTYTDDFTGLEVEEYGLSGDAACRAGVVVDYEEENAQYKEKLMTLGCGSRAYIKVKVHFK
jgi:hypothetical protein